MDGGYIIRNGRVESDGRDAQQMSEPFQWNLPEELWAARDPLRHELPFAGTVWDTPKSYEDLPNDFLMMCKSPGPRNSTFRVTKIDFEPKYDTESTTWRLYAVQSITNLQDMLKTLVVKYQTYANVVVNPVAVEVKLSDSPWLSYCDFDTIVPIAYVDLKKAFDDNVRLGPLMAKQVSVRARDLKYLRICNATTSFFRPVDPQDAQAKIDSAGAYIAEIKFTDNFMYLDYIQLQNLWQVNYTSTNAYTHLESLIASVEDTRVPGYRSKLTLISDCLKKLCTLLRPPRYVSTAGLQLADSALAINYIGVPGNDFNSQASRNVAKYAKVPTIGYVDSKTRDDKDWNRQYVHLTLFRVLTKRQPLYVTYMNTKTVYRKNAKTPNLRGKDVTESVFSLFDAIRQSTLQIKDLVGGTLFGTTSKEEYTTLKEVFDTTYKILVSFAKEKQQLDSGKEVLNKSDVVWPPNMLLQDAITVLYTVSFPSTVLSDKADTDPPFSVQLQQIVLSMFDPVLIPYLENVRKFYELADVSWAALAVFRKSTEAINKLFYNVLHKATPHGDNHDRSVSPFLFRDNDCEYSPPQDYETKTGIPKHMAFNNFLANILRFYVYKLAPGGSASVTWKPEYTGPYTLDLWTEYQNAEKTPSEQKQFDKDKQKLTKLFTIDSASKHAQNYYRYVFKDINAFCENLLWSTKDSDDTKFDNAYTNVRIIDLNTLDKLLLEIGTTRIGPLLQTIQNEAEGREEEESPAQVPETDLSTEREDEQGLLSILDVRSTPSVSPSVGPQSLPSAIPSMGEYGEGPEAYEPPFEEVLEGPEAAPELALPFTPPAAPLPRTTELPIFANRNEQRILAMRAPRTSSLLF